MTCQETKMFSRYLNFYKFSEKKNYFQTSTCKPAQFNSISKTIYLQIILGNVNVSILNRNDKVRYKDDYEKFKLILNGIALVLSVVNLLFNSR